MRMAATISSRAIGGALVVTILLILVGVMALVGFYWLASVFGVRS